MKILWLGTKLPVPPVDGGRLAVLETLKALHAQGAEVTLVAPVEQSGPDDPAQLARELAPLCRARPVPIRPRGRLLPLLTSLLGPPYAIARHTHPEVAAEVARLLDAEPFDVVHCEQLHALAQAEPARERGVPIVLRAQNVESDLWAATADLATWARPWLRREARRLAAHEGAAVRSTAATIALTDRDARRLEALAGDGTKVTTIPPPFPAELPPAETPLPGDPPLVLLGSGGWLPNRDAVRWFVREIWPAVRERCPDARLHLFAPAGNRRLRAAIERAQGVEHHPPPADSRDAFPRGSIQVVPLRIASGIRMKILEAWARGVPVVATPEAVAGLGVEDGREVVVGHGAKALVAHVVGLTAEENQRRMLTDAGCDALNDRYAPPSVAEALLGIYTAASVRAGPRSPR